MTLNYLDESKPKARRLEDAARSLGLSKGFLYKLEKAGKIRFVRIGGRTVITETEIDRILENGVKTDDAA